MVRTLNVRVLALLAGLPTALGLSVLGLHHVQVHRNAGALLAHAARAEGAGDFERAAVFYTRYLTLKPGDAAALARYGLMLDRVAEAAADLPVREQAAAVLERVARQDPGRLDVRRRLADLLIKMKRHDAATPHLEALLEARPGDGELEALLGECEEAVGRPARAAAWLEAARAHAPARLEVYVRLADLLRGPLGQAEKADTVMDVVRPGGGIVAANGRSGRAYLERARYRERYHLAGADGDVTRALELAPDDPQVVLAAARLAGDRGDFGRARGLVARARARDAGDPDVYRTAARVELRAGRPGAAVAALRAGLQAARPGAPGLRWSLADLLIREGDLRAAAGEVTALRREGGSARGLDSLEARVRMGEGRWAEAARLLERARRSPEEFGAAGAAFGAAQEVDVLLGRCYERLGNPDLAYAAFFRAVAGDPSRADLDTAARMGLAAALAGLGRPAEAVAEYRRLADRVPEAAVAAARLLVAGARGAVGPGPWPEVDQLLDRAGDRGPLAAEVAVARAEALEARGQAGAASDRLEKAVVEQPGHAGVWMALADLAARHRGEAAALAVLDRAAARLGDRVELRLARAGYWAARGGDEARAALARLGRGADAYAPDDRRRLERGLAGALATAGDPHGAERVLRRLADEQPDDLGLRLALFDLAHQRRDTAAMGRVLGELERVEGPEGVYWRYDRARLLLLKTGPDAAPAWAEARSLLAEAAARRPSWPRLPLLRAELAAALGDRTGQLRELLRAVDLGERDPGVVLRTAQLLYEVRRYNDADRLLRTLGSSKPPAAGPGWERLAADVSLRAGDPRRALELARRAVPPDSNGARDLVWRAQLCQAAGTPSEAELLLRRAAALSQGDPTPWVALVQYYARAGQAGRAEAALREAGPALAGAAGRVARGQCAEALGRWDEARALYGEALAAAPDDATALRLAAALDLRTGRLAASENHLRRLAGRTEAGSDDGAWARRTLAVVLALRGGPQRAREALRLVTPGPSGAVDDAPDARRARAQVLAARRSPGPRHEAIDLLQGLAAHEPPTAEDRFLLAQLYEADGARVKADEQMRTLLAAAGARPVHLAWYAATLLRRGQVDEARPLVERLGQAEPQSLRALDLQARLLRARGRGDEAVALLRAYARRPGAYPGRAAQLLEELGLTAAAEDLFRGAAARPDHPEASLELAGFLGRHGRTREALDLCGAAWRSCPPAAVAAVSLGVLYADPPGDEVFERAAARLGEAVRNDPGSPDLRFHLANLRSLQGRDGEAEALYRGLLGAGQAGGEVANNLAWLLALKGGRWSEALEVLDRAAAPGDTDPGLLDTRGVIYLAMGRSGPAIKDLQAAAALDPSPNVYFHLARAYALARDRTAAAAALRSAHAAGLVPGTIHPFERAAYRALVSALARDDGGRVGEG